MRQIEGGVTAAKGFMAASTEARIKYSGREDLVLLYAESPCTAAGVFTRNQVKAAPVLWDRALIDQERQVRAVVINAGIANACTGKEGEGVCKKTAQETARLLGIDSEEVLIASTGVIGMQIPFDKLKTGLLPMKRMLSPELEAGNRAAKAIMTTDTHEKECAVQFFVEGISCTLGGMAKGSGMIHPDMGTMLSFVTTDAAISRELLQKALSDVVEDTFNMISVDGDTSTNDTLLVLANGASGAKRIEEEGPAYEIFREALFFVCAHLSQMLAGDGEGATALFEVIVKGADTREHARTLAKSVITSSLTKAALFGHDANWGRILCALGYAGVPFDPEQVSLTITSANGTLDIFANGCALGFDDATAALILSAEKVTAICDMHAGSEEACAWGCDLSYDYVKINADYRS